MCGHGSRIGDGVGWFGEEIERAARRLRGGAEVVSGAGDIVLENWWSCESGPVGSISFVKLLVCMVEIISRWWCDAAVTVCMDVLTFLDFVWLLV